MQTSTLIIVIVAAAVVLLVALTVGLVLARKRRIDLSEDQRERPEDTPRAEYRAGGAISFATGATGAPTAGEHPPGERTEVDGQPGVGDDAAVPRDEPRRGITDVELPAAPSAEVQLDESRTDAPPMSGAAARTDTGAAAETGTAEHPPEGTDTAAEPAAGEPASEPVKGQPSQAEIRAEIAPTEGRLERLRGRLSRSRSSLGQGLLGLLGAGDLDEDSWIEVEDTLLLADLGAATTMDIVDRLRAEISTKGVRTPEQARSMLHQVMVEALNPDMDRSVHALPNPDGPAVVLVAGVNGTGKTTTTGKLARVLVAQGRTVLLGAADTFRAAAAEQLTTWGDRVGAEVVRGGEGADPAAVAFDAAKRGVQTGVDTVLVDTAGRLHTKSGLMDELGKVKRVVEKQATVNEVLLVLDATTGQNGLVQARVFAEVVDVTGVVLTKLDGTAKGGIVFQVQRELGVPVKLVGLGEGPDDLAPFEAGAFVDALLG
ncbi:MAG: signal recognition particle-docking protein FtsY [Sciscionella sp.]